MRNAVSELQDYCDASSRLGPNAVWIYPQPVQHPNICGCINIGQSHVEEFHAHCQLQQVEESIAHHYFCAGLSFMFVVVGGDVYKK